MPPTVQVQAVAPTHDLTVWARGDGLEIVLVVLGSLLVMRVIAGTGQVITRRIDRTSTEGDALVRSEQGKHRHSVAQVLVWLANVLVVCIAVVRIVNLLGFAVSGLVAPAAVLGVALGFGAQRVVQDLLAGFFIITERQYGFGDVIRIASLGSESGVTGTVEEISLRITRMRTVNGEVVIVPNGQISQVTNLSRDWARAMVDIPLWPNSDITEAMRLFREVGAAAFADPALNHLLLDEPTVMGVESISVRQVNVRIVARTLPGKQFEVGRALRARIVVALRERGITMPTDSTTVDESTTVGL
jgi:small conductance mechanosensitive channel